MSPRPLESESPFSPNAHRFLAYAADSFVILAMNMAGWALGAVVAKLVADPALGAPEQQQVVMLGAMLGWVFWGGAAWFLNYGILQGMTGASAGKHFFNLKVVREDGTPLGVRHSLTRSSAYFLSVLPVYLGFAMVLWDSRRRALHDRVCKTVVLRKDAIYPVGTATVPRFDDEVAPNELAA